MTIEQMKARLGEIINQMKDLRAKDSLNDEEATEVENLHTEAVSLKAQIETAQKMEEVENLSEVATRRTVSAPVAAGTVTGGTERVLENGNFGYNSAGEYFKEIRTSAIENSMSEKLVKAKKFQASQRESVGTDGGFLVPTTILDGVQSAIESDQSLLGRTNQLNISGNKAEIKVNMKAPWAGNGEHISAQWTGEGKKIDRSKAQFEDVTIKAEKLAALFPVTEEMAEDSVLIESFIRRNTPDVFVAAINNAIINGDGVKKPLGLLKSKFGFEVAKEGGQAAGTVVFENLKKLHSHALPKAKMGGIYLYNAGVEEELIGMKLDPSSTDSVSVYLPNNSIAGAPYGTLWGKPAFPMIGAMPGLGSKGDIVFADLSYYYTVLKVGGLKQRVSTDFLFDTDEMAFKYTFRMGGLCPFSEPQSTEFGGYKLSGFTYLQERA